MSKISTISFKNWQKIAKYHQKYQKILIWQEFERISKNHQKWAKFPQNLTENLKISPKITENSQRILEKSPEMWKISTISFKNWQKIAKYHQKSPKISKKLGKITKNEPNFHKILQKITENCKSSSKISKRKILMWQLPRNRSESVQNGFDILHIVLNSIHFWMIKNGLNDLKKSENLL